MSRRTVLSAFGLTVALALPACVASGSLRATGTTSSSAVVYQEPPQDQVETVSVRTGHVWVRGRWNWQNGQWAWLGGHWERERSGYAWQSGRWERRGSAWHWVEGRWGAGAPVDVHASGGVTVTSGTHPHGGPTGHGHGGHTTGGGGGVDVNASGGVVVTSGTNPSYPSAAPPAPRVESQPARGGFLWVTGRWDWKNGQWAWVDGHWERERANMVWTPGRWENQGGRWLWVEGSWTAGVRVRDHR